MKHFYKIDRVDGLFHKFVVYRKIYFLGISFWRACYRTNYLSQAESFVEECRGLPRYYP